MCFSAGASFTASVILSGVGVYSLKKADNPKQHMFAAIPLLFAFQQCSEGFLWLSLNHVTPEYLHTTITYIFLFFAQLFWPVYIPISILLLEKDARRKKILTFICGCGIITCIFLGFRMAFYTIYAEIRGHHIYYGIQSPQSIIFISSLLYIIAIVFPGFISGVKGMKLLALVIAVSLVITEIFYRQYLISVWCFFSAILSVVIIYVIRNHTIKNNSAAQLRNNATIA